MSSVVVERTALQVKQFLRNSPLSVRDIGRGWLISQEDLSSFIKKGKISLTYTTITGPNFDEEGVKIRTFFFADARQLGSKDERSKQSCSGSLLQWGRVFKRIVEQNEIKRKRVLRFIVDVAAADDAAVMDEKSLHASYLFRIWCWKIDTRY